MASRTKIDFLRVKNLPTNRPLDNGHFYVVEKPNKEFLLYNVTPDGEPNLIRGITDDQLNRLEQLTQPLLTKISEDYSKGQIDDIVQGLIEDIDNIIVGSSAGFVKVNGTVLPSPETNNNYSIVGEGTYTRAGQSDVVVPSGHMGILNWDGSEWYLGSSVEMPDFVADGEIAEGDDRAVSGDTAYKRLMRKDEFLTTKGKNLYDKSKNEGGFINSDGTWVYSAVQDTSGFIPVEKDVTYTMSGGFNATSAKRVLLFGSRDNQDIIDFFIGVDTFTPSADGFIKTNANTLSSDISETLQIEVGTTATAYEPYNPNKQIKDKYIHIPVGEIKASEDGFVQGGEVFEKTLVKDIYLYKERESVNLFDKESVQFGKSLSLTNIFDTVNQGLAISDYIPVQKGVKYSISGWFRLSDSYRRVGIFENYGDTEALEVIVDEDSFIPNVDGYAVLRVITATDNPSYDRRNTLQVQVGDVTPYEPYSDKVQEKIKPEYIPSTTDNHETRVGSFNKIDVSKVMLGYTVDNDGAIQESQDDKDFVFANIPTEQTNFIFAKGLPSNNSHKIHLLKEDGTLNFRGEISFTGNICVTRNRPNTNSIHLSGRFDEEEELNDICLSFVRAEDDFLSLNKNSSPYSKHLPSPIYPKLAYNVVERDNSDKGLTFRQFSITTTSDFEDREIVIPMMLTWGYAPDGARTQQKHLFMQEKCDKDFSDIVIVNSDDKVLPIKIFNGNYSLVPFYGYMAMFQDQTDKQFVIGANRGGGIFLSSDYGKTYSQLKPTGQLCFMDGNGDIFYMVKDSTEASIVKSTKSSGYGDANTVFVLPYLSSVISPAQFTRDDSGNIYMGTYQTEFDSRVYKSGDGGLNWELKFSNTDHQHVHSIDYIPETGELWLVLDGAVDGFQNIGADVNSGMALYKSIDGGDTWEIMPLPFTSDKGYSFKLGDYYYGAGESLVKYTPSLFRTKDYKSFEVLNELPAMNSRIAKYDDRVLQVTQAYRTYPITELLLSNDGGKSMLPIFTSHVYDSDFLGNAYRYGSYDSYSGPDFLEDENGDKFAILTSNDPDLQPLKLTFGEDDYQALVLVKTKVSEGQNVFRVIPKGEKEAPEFSLSPHFKPDFEISFKNGYAKTSDSNAIKYNQDVVYGVGCYDSIRFPYKHKGVSVSLPKGLKVRSVNRAFKTFRFGYKALTNNQNSLYANHVMFEGENFEISRENQQVVVSLNGGTYSFDYVFRTQYAYVPNDIVITINGGKIALYGNGFLMGEHNIVDTSFEVESLHILPPNKEYTKENIDLVSDILFYDQGFNSHDVKTFIDKVTFI